jgi:AraC-like DNA-binding protein
VKIQLETIAPESKSPFRLLHDPKLSHLFYWHFHPELELVYIEGASAKRHVGDHISEYEGSDLVLIGSNIPHLNFDHGVTTPYRKEVLHIKPSFKEVILEGLADLKQIERLLELSKYGIAFYGSTKGHVGQAMKTLHTLEPFDFFMEVMRLLKLLSQSKEFQLLHKAPYETKYHQKEQKRLRDIYAFLDEQYHRKISLAEVADLSNLSPAAFCRYFKKNTGSTFTHFMNQYRISQAQRMLLKGSTISETCFACGFESLSYFNRTFKKVVNEGPSTFKNRFKNS